MEWVKVSDSLPENRQNVLCIDKEKRFYTAIYKIYANSDLPHHKGYPDWYHDFCCDREPYDPEYWMPLPNPPQENNKYDDILNNVIKEGNEKMASAVWMPLPTPPQE